MADRSDPRRTTKKQRTKCFTGCWTCRTRRVKCDEGRPACRKCTQSGHQCEGYGVRLNWSRSGPRASSHRDEVQPDSRKTSVVDKQSVQPGTLSPETNEPMEEIQDRPNDFRHRNETYAIPSIPASSPEVPPIIHQGSGHPTPQWHRDSGIRTPSDSPFTIASASGFSVDDAESTTSLTSIRPPYLTDMATSPTDSAQTDKYSPNLQLSKPDTVSSSDSGFVSREEELKSSQWPGSMMQAAQQPTPRHLDSLAVPAEERRLIHHWVTYTSGKLVLLDGKSSQLSPSLMKTLMT